MVHDITKPTINITKYHLDIKYYLQVHIQVCMHIMYEKLRSKHFIEGWFA